MASKVYFADFRCPSWRENLQQKLARLMMSAGFGDIDMEGKYTFVVMGIALIAVAFLAGLLGDTVTLILLLCAVCGGSAWIYLYSYLVYVGKMK